MTALDGQSLGIIGPLEAVPRRLASRAVEAQGGRLRRGLTRSASAVVFGRRLLDRADAEAIAADLAAVTAAGCAAWSEAGFLRRLGVLPANATPEAAALTRRGLIDQSGLAEADFDLLAVFDAFETDTGPFGFRDLILARKYARLIADGAGWLPVARAVRRAADPAALTAQALALAGDDTIVARHGTGTAELDGQGRLDLAPAADADPDALFAAAEAAEADGDLAEAATLYGRALAADPGDSVAAFNRANCLRELGRAAEATHDYARAVKIDPGFVEAWFNLAGLMSDSGHVGAARRHLTRALERDPGYADAAFNLAKLEFDSGRLDQARRWWERYLELDPDSEWGRRAAKGLQLVALQAAVR